MSTGVNQQVISTNNQNPLIVSNYEEMIKVSKALAESTIIPKEYQKNPANCFVALEMAQRIGASPMMVMQNLYMVNGKPGWSSSFIIATINTSGRFKTPLQFKMEGSGENRSCIAFAISKDGTLCEGPKVDIAMAKAEGWYQKNGSKWQTMPEIMLRYRAAAFFGRQYCPELLMGMQTVEEIIEISEADIKVLTPEEVKEKANSEIAANANTGELIDVPTQEETKIEEIPQPEEPKTSPQVTVSRPKPF